MSVNKNTNHRLKGNHSKIKLLNYKPKGSLPVILASAELLVVRAFQIASFDAVGVESVAVVGTGYVVVSVSTSECAMGAVDKVGVALDTSVE